MKITVIGAGKVGRTLCEQLCGEGHDVTAIDLSDELLSALDSRLDIQCVSGSKCCSTGAVVKARFIEWKAC